eukprot:scaffold393246_cov19-Prasinocladus_malaysianus.AAC.1
MRPKVRRLVSYQMTASTGRSHLSCFAMYIAEETVRAKPCKCSTAAWLKTVSESNQLQRRLTAECRSASSL